LKRKTTLGFNIIYLLKSMLNKFKELIVVTFFLSLVASYSGCLGYYSVFHLDITSYISVEDLILIYAKWIWLTGFFLFALITPVYSFFISNKSKENWWDKTIGKTKIKKRIYYLAPVIVTVIVLSIIYGIIANIVSIITMIGLAFIVIGALISLVYSYFQKAKELSQITLSEWNRIIAIATLFVYIIPLFAAIPISRMKPDNLIVKLDENLTINTVNNVTLKYIGKTSKFFFIYNTATKTTTAYSMERAKSFELVQ
jgi:hypothetical protein